MKKQTYEEYKKEQVKLANKQARDKYKKQYKTASNKLEKVSSGTGKAISNISKAYGYDKKLSNTLLGYSNAFGGQQTQQKSVGRPKGVMKWRSPMTGKPVPAQQYYKDLRLFKRIQEQRAAQAQQIKQAELAKRGITPEMLQQIEQAKQIREQQIQQTQVQTQQVNQVNQLPNGVIIPRGTQVWKYRRGITGQEGGLFGPVKKVYGLPESFWN